MQNMNCSFKRTRVRRNRRCHKYCSWQHTNLCRN